MLQEKLCEQVKEQLNLERRKDTEATKVREGEKLDKRMVSELQGLSDTVERRLQAMEEQVRSS